MIHQRPAGADMSRLFCRSDELDSLLKISNCKRAHRPAEVTNISMFEVLGGYGSAHLLPGGASTAIENSKRLRASDNESY